MVSMAKLVMPLTEVAAWRCSLIYRMIVGVWLRFWNVALALKLFPSLLAFTVEAGLPLLLASRSLEVRKGELALAQKLWMKFVYTSLLLPFWALRVLLGERQLTL